MNKILVIIVICLNFSLNGKSQIKLDTILVTTLKAPLKISETGRNITVLTAKQIEEIPATSLDEILQTVAGVEVQSRGGFGVQADITLRGSTFTQVLILVDGIKINDPLTGHFNGYIPVTLGEIERIEILRGTASALYGTNAVGGVINIITNTFSNTTEGIHHSGNLYYGSHNLVSGHQGFSVKKGAATFGGGFSMNQSEGEYFQEKIIDTTTTLDAYNNFFDIKTAGVSFAYQFKNNVCFRARSAYDFRDFDARYFYTNSTFDKSEETVTEWLNYFQIEKINNSSSTDFNTSFKYNTDKFVFSPDFPSTNNHVSQLLSFSLNHLQVLNDNILLKAGSQVDQRKIESNDRGNHDDFHFGAYAMGVYQKNGLHLSVSFRGDYDANYDFEFSPQLNVSYVLPSFVFRGSVGRSIRAADYTERYVSNNLKDLTPGRSLGNPNLLAERGWSQEIGMDYRASKNWQLKTTVFSRQSTNLIDFVSTDQTEIGSVSDIGTLQENANYFFAKNITDVKTVGLEAESNLIYRFGKNSKFQWNLGYTFLSTSNDEQVISVYISSHAKHVLTSKFNINLNRVDLGIVGLYKQRTALIASNIDSELSREYIIWNAHIGFRITENFGLNFQTQNVFNEQYQNILGARMPSRWLMGGVKWKL